MNNLTIRNHVSKRSHTDSDILRGLFGIHPSKVIGLIVFHGIILWRGKTEVTALLASHYSYKKIDCSFEKPIPKIVADIKRRLLPKYYEKFMIYQKEKRELEQNEKEQEQRLFALAQVSGGEVTECYHHRAKEYIPLENFEISASYDDSYKISIRASFGEALKIAEYLKEFYKTEKPDSL